MSFHEEIFLEESIDTLTKGDVEALELPLSRRTFLFILVLIVLVGVGIGGRLLFLNQYRGNFYQTRSAANMGKDVLAPAARGLIFDRYDKPLVENISTFSVSVKAQDALRVAHLLNLPTGELEQRLKNFNYEDNSTLILTRDLDPEKVVYLKSLNLAGVEIINDYKRYYPNGAAFAHVLGYTGLGPDNQFIGRAGVESFYDAFLRGKDGHSVVYRNAVGQKLDTKQVTLAENGNNLYTTLDADLQNYVYQRVGDQLAFLGRKAGVGIVLQPQTGEVLSLVSFPSFDSNLFNLPGKSAERLQLLNSSSKPILNRAIAGVYTPGSVVKPMVAVGALKEGVVTAQTQIFSAGFIEIPNPYFPDQPSRFLDWKPHGWVDVRSAIARSSNIYFYAAGGGLGEVKGLGIERLKKYWQAFGFGQKTGIDLSPESEGSLPDPEIKEKKKHDIWRIGDTYNVTIGQGDLLVTPIQIISQIASIANGGKFYTPFFMNKITDASGTLIKTNQPRVVLDNSSLEPYLKEVRHGMEDAVSKSYGTAHLLSTLPIVAAGKTGSSQVSNNTKTNAFFVGYAPADNPQVIILILIEDAIAGSLNAVPVGKDIIDWYYQHRLSTRHSL